jgi:peptide/nickel transport system substrate-binding protein
LHIYVGFIGGKKIMKMNRKIAGLVICLLLLGIALAIYIAKEPKEVRVPQILKVGIRCFAHADGLVDPARGWSGWFSRRAGIYETLTKIDHNMELQPWLATAWEQVDENTWEFDVRQGVIFHDGTPLTAESVAFSLNSLLQESGPRFNSRAQPLLNIKEIKVVDKHTLRIVTERPFAPLIYHLSDPLFAIVSPNVKEGEIPAGTGPFKFVEQRVAEYVTVKRFNDYWDGPAKLDKVTFYYMPEAAVRAMALEVGDIDVAIGIPPADARRFDEKEDIRVSKSETTRTTFVIINCKREPLSDSRVRRAINYAIDREGIINAVLEDVGGISAATIFPPILPWANRDLKAVHNLSQARILLRDAGLVDINGDGWVEYAGAPFSVRFFASTHREEFRPIGEIIKANLKEVGIRVEVVAMELGAVRARERVHNFELSIASWGTAPSGDPAYIVEMLSHSAGEHNYGKFSHEGLDELLSRGKITFNLEERKAIYNEVQKILHDKSPLLFLYHHVELMGMSDVVQELKAHPAEMYLLHKDVYLN